MSRFRKLRKIFPNPPSIEAMKFSTARSSFGWAKSAFSRSGSKCPDCGGDVEVKERTDQNVSDQVAHVLVCQDCGKEESIDHLMDTAVEGIDSLRRGERQLFLSGAALFIGTTVLALFNGDALTFFGGAIFALILMQRALLYRYRAWQITNRRLFSKRPPIRLWLADEFKQ